MKTQPRAQSDSSTILTALSVSPQKGDHLLLRKIFERSNWELFEADCLASALRILYRHNIDVVLCERDLPLNTWTDMWDDLSAFPNAPALIVTSRFADDRLWAEALNLGAYDVLAKPFDEREVVRVVSSAWQHHQHSRTTQGSRRAKVMTAAGGSSASHSTDL